jgi:valyl-tRNA synthetase
MRIRCFQELVRGVRNIRTEMNVPSKVKTDIYIVGKNEEAAEEFRRLFESLGDSSRMLFAKVIDVVKSKENIDKDSVSVVMGNATAYIPMDELVDREKEIERLTKESEKMDREIARSEGMLNNPKFVSKAPAAKVEEEKAKLAHYQAMKQQLAEQLAGYINK